LREAAGRRRSAHDAAIEPEARALASRAVDLDLGDLAPVGEARPRVREPRRPGAAPRLIAVERDERGRAGARREPRLVETPAPELERAAVLDVLRVIEDCDADRVPEPQLEVAGERIGIRDDEPAPVRLLRQ